MEPGSVAAYKPASSLALIFEQSMPELDRSWEAFLGGASRDQLIARTPILDSWERCRNAEVNLSITNAPLLSMDSFEARRQENRLLLNASADTLEDATRMLHDTDTIMLITDAEGIVLKVSGDDAATRAGMDIALSEGGDWKEHSAGTNGIGVALASARPMLVHAGEHYCQRMKEWSCAAVPLYNPEDGSVLGILNLSARSQDANATLLSIAVFNAHRVEQALAHQEVVLRGRLLEAALERNVAQSDGLLILDNKGRLTYASNIAAQLLRSRLSPKSPGLVPGQPIFQPSASTTDNLPTGIAKEWIKPIYLDGEVGGYTVTVPSASKRNFPTKISPPREGDESDPRRSSFSAIIGDSPQLNATIARTRKVAARDVPVLIEGETGVGKELFARAIHGNSKVSDGPFITFNCGAISRELIASELFGYTKGAFTGASANGRKGRFELAHGGTLCLDEIGELAPDLQSYLLRVLEEGVLSRIGENRIRKVDVRVIAMTNRDLPEEIAAGRFRPDLFHRLAVLRVPIPPLRDRDGDTQRLIAHFTSEMGLQHGSRPITFTPAALTRLQQHGWPGNVRELRNAVETAAVMAEGGTADVDCLPAEIAAIIATPPKQISVPPEKLRQKIEQAIAASGGNVSAACVLLGMSRSTLYRRMVRLGIQAGGARITTTRL